MKAVTSTLVLLTFLFANALTAKTIFVKPGATGNGTAWSNPQSLQAALASAQAGDKIWVARGKYTPTSSTDRTVSFEVPDGVKIYGGFVGQETALNQRNWKQNITILSGEIGSPSKDDNSYTIVYTKNVSSATIVDGFIILGGTANGVGAKGNRERCGGGWFNDSENGSSSPTIKNCTFARNIARDGAGLYNYAKNGNCAPRIINCEFKGNRADLDGGAIYNDGRMGVCKPVIKGCIIVDNIATYGGGILNIATGGECSPAITSCNFENNTGAVRGGSMYSSQEGGICQPVITATNFSDNKATVGKEVNTDNSSTSTGSSTGFIHRS